MPQLSPALRHWAQMTAARAAGGAEAGGQTIGTAYELMLCKLADDRRRLKSIQSVQRKIEVKASLLPEYQQWTDAALKHGRGAQDDVLTAILVWHIDTGDYERALEIAAYAQEHKLTLPDQYKRDLPTMLIDEFSAAYLNGPLRADPDRATDLLASVARMTESDDAPDQARAKLFKAQAYALIATLDQDDDTDTEDDADTAAQQISAARIALAHLQAALKLFEGVGVKKDIERLERRIARFTNRS